MSLVGVIGSGVNLIDVQQRLLSGRSSSDLSGERPHYEPLHRVRLEADEAMEDY